MPILCTDTRARRLAGAALLALPLAALAQNEGGLYIADQQFAFERVAQRALAANPNGQRFFVLDSTGSLHVWTHGASGWVTAAPVAGVIASMPTAAPFPALATSAAVNEIYLTDPVAQQLITLDSATLAVKSRRPLGFVPAHATWVGIAR